MPLIPRRLPLLSSSSLLMGTGSRHLLLKCPAAGAALPAVPLRRLCTNLRKSPSRTVLFALRSSGFRPPRQLSLTTTRDVHVAPLDAETNIDKRFKLIKEKLEELGFDYGDCVPGQHTHKLCPKYTNAKTCVVFRELHPLEVLLFEKYVVDKKCEGGESKEKSLSFFIREDGGLAMWRCFRGKCGWSGSIQDGKMLNVGPAQTSKGKKYRMLTEQGLQLEPLCEEILAYLNERMISSVTLRRNAVMQRRYKDETVIAFPYRRNGVLVSCKYRGIEKKFWQESDTERIFYGLDDIRNATDIIIVEGELDKLAMEEAGYRNCVSVPDGAPGKVSKDLPAEDKDTKFQYLWNCKDYLNQASRIILATDADDPGQALAEELARRLGKERCWRVKWPTKADTQVCKDANEVLMYKGPDALREVIENAELYPIRGLFNFSSFFHDIDDYYYCRNGYERGVSTGWRSLNGLYNVVPGELSVITGVPNSGKSEWIDALLCNINKSEGWTFALCSMENKVREHARKLLEKYIGKPFFDASYGGSAERMSEQELKHGKQWLNETFHLIRCEDDCLPSINWVLNLAKAAVLRNGVRGLVIDPYNELDHQRPPNQTETEYVSQMLTKIKRFAQHHSCHVWFVAHPRQLQQWGGGPPNLYDISGSAHFINKCDNGIVIHRNRDEKAGPLDRVQVCVRKVRNKVIGNIGDAFLSYDRITGQFNDLDDNAQSK